MDTDIDRHAPQHGLTRLQAHSHDLLKCALFPKRLVASSNEPSLNDEAVLGFYRKLGFEVSLWAEEMAKNHTKKRTQPATIKMHRDVFKDL